MGGPTSENGNAEKSKLRRFSRREIFGSRRSSSKMEEEMKLIAVNECGKAIARDD